MKFTASALVLYSLVATSSNAFTTIPSTTTSTTRTAPQQQKQHQQQKPQWLTTASTTARHVATEPQAETATTAKKTREVSVFLVHAGVFVIATLWYSSSSSSSIYIYINIYIYSHTMTNRNVSKPPPRASKFTSLVYPFTTPKWKFAKSWPFPNQVGMPHRPTWWPRVPLPKRPF